MIVGIGLVVLGAAIAAWAVWKIPVNGALLFVAGSAIAIIGGCIFAGQLIRSLL